MQPVTCAQADLCEPSKQVRREREREGNLSCLPKGSQYSELNYTRLIGHNYYSDISPKHSTSFHSPPQRWPEYLPLCIYTSQYFQTHLSPKSLTATQCHLLPGFDLCLVCLLRDCEFIRGKERHFPNLSGLLCHISPRAQGLSGFREMKTSHQGKCNYQHCFPIDKITFRAITYH